jgi:hypothetical protein
VPRVSAPAAVFPSAVLLGLWLERSAFVVDNDEMESGCFEQAHKIGGAYQMRLGLSIDNYVTRHGGLERQFALTEIGSFPRSAYVSVGREVDHGGQSDRRTADDRLKVEVCGSR